MANPYISGRDLGKVYLDVVEVNASEDLRKALSISSGAPADCHMLLDRSALPLLQGMQGTAGESLKRECMNLSHQVQANGIVIICPHAQ